MSSARAETASARAGLDAAIAPQDAETGSEALLGMGPVREDGALISASVLGPMVRPQRRKRSGVHPA
jgi:hypothetical protein